MVELEVSNAQVCVTADILVDGAGNNVEVSSGVPELDVTVSRKEYSIVGDELYIPKRYEDAPAWLQALVDQTILTAIEAERDNLNNTTESLNTLITELEVAKNTYTQSIISSNDIDSRINTAVTTLNSTLGQSIANVLDVAQTATTPDEVRALVISGLSAELEKEDVGTLGAIISSLEQAVIDGDSANATSIESLEASLEAESINRATAVNTINAYVGIDNAGASTGTGLSAYLEGADGSIGGAESRVANNVYVDSNGQTRSTFEYQSLLNIDGQYYNSGFGLVTSNSSGSGTALDPYNSEFWINAEKLKFTNSNVTGQATPFTIDASGTQPRVTFNGLVTFGSGQTGTIDEAISAVVETVAVGDKNINITDNLIPTTSLVADTDNGGYQFVGDPVKSNAVGIDSFAEAQIVLDSNDEVYSPYVDELTISYYYRFGVKGITSLSNFKIVSINTLDTVTYGTVVVTEQTESFNATEWYVIDGLINPRGTVIGNNGSIRKADGTKIGTVQNYNIPSGSVELLVGWQGSCTISRMKLAKITADTVTGNVASVDYVDNSKTALANSLGALAYEDIVEAAKLGTTVIEGGYLKSNLIEAGTITADKIDAYAISGKTISGGTITGTNLYGTYIEGAIIKASYIDLTSTATLTNWQQYSPATYPSAYDANFAKNNDGTLLVDSEGYVRLMGNTNIVTQPYYTHVASLGGVYDFVTGTRDTLNKTAELYPNNSYQISTLNRVITSTPTVRFIRYKSSYTPISASPDGNDDNELVHISELHGTVIIDVDIASDNIKFNKSGSSFSITRNGAVIHSNFTSYARTFNVDGISYGISLSPFYATPSLSAFHLYLTGNTYTMIDFSGNKPIIKINRAYVATPSDGAIYNYLVNLPTIEG